MTVFRFHHVPRFTLFRGIAVFTAAWLAACTSPLPAPVPAVLPVLIASPVSQTPPLPMVEGTDRQMLVRFTVMPDGRVQQPETVLSALAPEERQAVLADFVQWRFRPAVENGQPVPRTFIYPLFFGPDADAQRTRFFCHHQSELYAPEGRCDVIQSGVWRVYRVTPAYPAEATQERVPGSVTLGFDIGKDGRARNAKVIHSSPAGVFDAAALAAVSEWLFEPLSGTPPAGPASHVTVTVTFTPPGGASAPAAGTTMPSGV